MNSIKKLICTTAIFIIAALSISACSDSQENIEIIDFMQQSTTKNAQSTLSVATYITKIDGTYFISDCYHDQVIYSDSLEAPLTDWNVLTDEVHYAHTIASDTNVILVDDTENNRLLAFQKTKSGYMHTQTLEGTGLRPHYIQYDAQSDTFIAYSSMTGELFLVKKDKPDKDTGIIPLYIDKILRLDELYGIYVRSFTFMDSAIYFVSGNENQKIIRAELGSDGNSLEVTQSYDVPEQIAGMVQLTRIEDYYYITVSTDSMGNQDYATIIRCKDLSELAEGGYEDIYAQFGISGGTPYYITQIEGRYYMAHHRTSQNIIAFDVIENEIQNVEIIY